MKGPTLMGFYSIQIEEGSDFIIPFCTLFTDSPLKSTRAAALLASKVQIFIFFYLIQKIISIAFCRGEIHGYGSRLSSHAYCTLCTSQMRTWWHLTTQTYTTQRWKSFKVILMTKTTTFFWTTKSIPFLPHHLLMTKYRTKKSYWMKRKKKFPKNYSSLKKILAKNTTCKLNP